MKKSFLLLFFALTILAACQPKVDRLAVSGQLKNAAGEKLYIDLVGTTAVNTIDSITLDSVGSFCFKVENPVHFDLYRLRSSGTGITVAVLPGQNVEVTASLPNMNGNYSVNGGTANDTLRMLIAEQMRMESELVRMVRNSQDSYTVQNQKLREQLLIDASIIKNDYIYPNPLSPAAYYALFISMNGIPLFSPTTNRADAKTFATVASQYDFHYPGLTRGVHLRNVALKAMDATKQYASTPASDSVQKYFNSLVRETGLIDIELPNLDGNICSLSELKGKVVLLDFTAYNTDYSAEYTLLLRDVYSRFDHSDFEIYQISLDPDQYFWRNAADPLPWIAVNDERGLDSPLLDLYRVDAIPSAFLIDSDNNITERLVTTDSLTYKIAALIDKKYAR